MERAVRSGGPMYAQAVTDLWEGVGTALVRLERIAESSADALGDELAGELPGLQYSLHAGAELAVGIEPPPDGEALHEEFVSALAEARDATAEIAVALDSGDDDLVCHLLPEWRGSLFRVRLARLRALEQFASTTVRTPVEPLAARPERERGPRLSITAVVAAVLVVGGALLFTAGAVLVAWPVWAAGLALLAGGFVLSRP